MSEVFRADTADDGGGVYPISIGAEFDPAFVAYDFNRFLNSEIACGGDLEVIGVAHMMQMRSILQDPPGTLPRCEKAQAALAGMPNDVERWRSLVARGALCGWWRCLCTPPDGWRNEARLMHPLIYLAIKRAGGS